MNEVPYFKFYRSETGRQLREKNPYAFMLLIIIGERVQRTNKYNKYGLQIGEAAIGVGDFEKMGWTEGLYRGAKKCLKNDGFATFKGTSKGTIATLTNFEIVDPNVECDNELLISQATNNQRAANEQLTTTKNDKNDKNANNYYWYGRQPPERDVGQGKDKLKQTAKPLQAQPQESKVMLPEEHKNISKMLKECQRKMEAS